jgi:hypothetical protein
MGGIGSVKLLIGFQRRAPFFLNVCHPTTGNLPLNK